MTISTAVTQNETANKALERGIAGSLWHDDSVNLGNQSGTQPYWLQDTIGKRPRLTDTTTKPEAQTYSAPEARISEGHYYAGLMLRRTFPELTAQAFDVNAPNVWFPAIHPAECPIFTLLDSHRNMAAARESDRSAMAVTSLLADVGLARTLAEYGTYSTVSFDPISLSLLKAYNTVPPSTGTTYNILPDLPDSLAESRLMSLPWSIEDRELPTTEVSNSAEFMKKLIGSALFVTRNTANVGFAGWDSSPSDELLYNPIMRSFAEGFAGICPSIGTLEIASKIVQVAFGKTSAREIEVDDVDGALAFELRMSDGLLLVGELSIDGNLHANVYNDQHPSANAEINELWVKHLPHASAEDLFDLIR